MDKIWSKHIHSSLSYDSHIRKCIEISASNNSDEDAHTYQLFTGALFEFLPILCIISIMESLSKTQMMCYEHKTIVLITTIMTYVQI